MDPIPETTEAVDEFGPFTDTEGDLLDELRLQSTQVQALVPSCMGLSVTSRRLAVTFTMVASSTEIALLDAAQYLDGGPCLEAGAAGDVVELGPSAVLDEERWQVFARVSAAAGVRSTLTLPIVVDEAVVGTVNLYASDPDAFAGHHDAIAEIFGAWAPGAVSNADLAFSTRGLAEQAPAHLHSAYRIDVATAITARLLRIDVDSAREELHRSAVRAGVDDLQIAEIIIDLQRSDEPRSG